MAETAHAPGPWRVHFNAPTAAIPGHLIETDDDVRHPVALLWEGGGTKGKPRQIANARLIAAAPELLEALRSLVGALERAAGAGIDLTGHVGLGGALRAIAKAEGRSDG